MMTETPHEQSQEQDPDKLVFFNGGKVVQCTSDELHSQCRRDDFAFALDMEGLPDEAMAFCAEYELPIPVYGPMIADAMHRASMAAGVAACVALAVQRYNDGTVLPKSEPGDT